MLIIVCGLPGSGKSISAKKIAAFFRGTHLNTDIIRKRLFLRGTPEQSAASPERYDLEFAFDRLPTIPPDIQELIWKQKEHVYSRMFEEAERELRAKNVILDATFYQKKNRERAYRAAANAGAEVFVVECLATENIIRSRLARRKFRKRVSNVADMNIFEKVKKKYEEPVKDGVPLLIYNTSFNTFRYFNVMERKQLLMLKKLEEVLRIPLHTLRRG